MLGVLILVFLPTAYLFSGPYLDRRAVRKANEFCAVVAVGDAMSDLVAKAEASNVALENWGPSPNGQLRFMATFPGFLMNVVHCEISVEEGRVRAKFVETWFW